jgi:hypothetical protein
MRTFISRKVGSLLLLGLLTAFLALPYIHLSLACDVAHGHSAESCDVCQLRLNTPVQVAAIAAAPLGVVQALPSVQFPVHLTAPVFRLPRAHAPRGPPAA